MREQDGVGGQRRACFKHLHQSPPGRARDSLRRRYRGGTPLLGAMAASRRALRVSNSKKWSALSPDATAQRGHHAPVRAMLHRPGPEVLSVRVLHLLFAERLDRLRRAERSEASEKRRVRKRGAESSERGRSGQYEVQELSDRPRAAARWSSGHAPSAMAPEHTWSPLSPPRKGKASPRAHERHSRSVPSSPPQLLLQPLHSHPYTPAPNQQQRVPCPFRHQRWPEGAGASSPRRRRAKARALRGRWVASRWRWCAWTWCVG